jgi:hypothetical protein
MTSVNVLDSVIKSHVPVRSHAADAAEIQNNTESTRVTNPKYDLVFI